MQGILALDKETTVSSSPVVSLKALRTVTAAAAIVAWDIRTEDFQRAYLQADRLPVPVCTRIPPEAGEPDDHVWAFNLPIFGKDDADHGFLFTQCRAILRTTDLSSSHTHEAVYFSPSQGALCTYSDDTYSAGTPCFTTTVDTLMARFRTHLSSVNDVRFAVHISASPSGISTDGNAYPPRLDRIPTPAGSQDTTPLANPTRYKSVAAGPYKKRRRDIPGLHPGIPGNLGSLTKSVSQQRFTRDSETEEIDSCGSSEQWTLEREPERESR